MRKIAFLILSLLFAGTGIVEAQQLRVSGRVLMEEDGSPVVGATVIASESPTIGTTTDPDGKFSLLVPATVQTLEVSFVGLEKQKVAVSRQPMTIRMRSSLELSEVVVTALGISREKKSLGYSAQEVGAETITKAAQMNVATALSGKIAGLQVTSAGGQLGASQNIVIRGNSSFGGSNQPLIVIDGVPVSNDNPSNNGYAGEEYYDLGSGINDINPNDIESISVLKGGSAALYGMRAGNGVIVITTKSGKRTKGVRVSYDGDFTVDRIYGLPKLQNKYGQGYGGSEYDWKQAMADSADPFYGTYEEWATDAQGWGYGYWYIDGANGTNDGDDESWGPRLDVGLQIPQFTSPVVDGEYQPTPWVSHPNNIKDFFVTGLSQNHTVSLSAAGEKFSTRASISYRGQDGTVPNTNLDRFAASINSTFMVNKWIDFDVAANYIRTTSNNLPGIGYSTLNPMQSLLQWFGRQVDMKALKANYDEMKNGQYTHYNWISPFHANPYWTLYHNTDSYSRNRTFGKASLWIKPTEYLKFEGRVGVDNISSTQLLSVEWNTDYPDGYFRDYTRGTTEINADFIGYFKKNIGAIDVNALAGANFRDYSDYENIIGGDQLIVPALYTVTNVKGSPIAEEDHATRRSNSVYANLSLGWENQLYFDASIRNDWDSSLDDSFLYPAFSGSWIISQSLPELTAGYALSFLKLRGGWAKIGNATTPYRSGSYYRSETSGMSGVALYSMPRTFPPQGLRPEMVKTWEVGVEANFLDNRIRLDAAYYNKNTSDQIMSVDISRATGYSTMLINAGEIVNKGAEVQLSADVLKNANGFNWTTTLNWAKDKSEIKELYTDPATGQSLQAYQIGSQWSVANLAIPGKSWGTLRGSGYRRDADGNIITRDGIPLYDSGMDIGNVMPDWIGGWNNEFSYKNVSLGFLLDFRKGGDMFSVSQMFGAYTGIYDITAKGDIRENGMVIGEDLFPWLNFVDEASGEKNTTVANPMDVFGRFYYVKEMSVFDGSYVKLREAHISYSLPRPLLDRLNVFSSARISLVGNNLALLWTHKSNLMKIDPESTMGAGNSMLGFEQNVYPHTRSIGLKLSVTF
ncbi:MAG: SusC/RagA family TonB-linked outer membrane protein [Bacteroidales bacterium]|jgi:TonB-linked SusC/RagA family outer membrane protein|nr:SusC/RagA family TonB-linked outer membrane protein [Bacteroidales bacterium]